SLVPSPIKSSDALDKPARELSVPRGHPVVDAIALLVSAGVGAVPLAGSPIATILSGGYAAAKERRLNLFLDELVCHLKEIPKETIESEEFLQAVTSAARASASTQQNDKIRLFAQMFATYANGQIQISSDEYEEQTRILEGMS